MKDVSIIIPTRNRAALLLKTLTSVANTIAGSDSVEVIVVDNGSVDDTADVFNEVRTLFPKQNWHYFYDDMPGQLTGRHLGAIKAQGEILAFIDDDIILSSSWLKSVDEAFDRSDFALVGGPSLPKYEVEPPSWLSGMWSDFENGSRVLGALSLIDLGQHPKEVEPLLIPGLNFSIRRDSLFSCGGFHPDYLPRPLQRYQGDGETGLALKLRHAGLRALYHPGASVTHFIPRSRLTPQYFEQRGFYQGIGKSYACIRQKKSLPARRNSFEDFARSTKWTIERYWLLGRGTDRAIRTLVARARSVGSQFHEKCVCSDPMLFDWILRPDYFDYRLPNGWQKLLSAQTARFMEGWH